jgi:hypothetical protein
MMPFGPDPETVSHLGLIDRERAFRNASLRHQAREARRHRAGSPHTLSVSRLLSGVVARLQGGARRTPVLECVAGSDADSECVVM